MRNLNRSVSISLTNTISHGAFLVVGQVLSRGRSLWQLLHLHNKWDHDTVGTR